MHSYFYTQEISAWLKIGTSFTDKNGKDIQAIAIGRRKLGSNIFPEVNTRVSYSYAVKNV